MLNRFALIAGVGLFGFWGTAPTVAHPGNSHSRPDVDKPCQQVLIPVEPLNDLDSQLAKLQKNYPNARNPAVVMEKIGWLWVEKARRQTHFDLYDKALLAADCLATLPDSLLAARLLQSHAYLNQHRFAEAERLARELVAKRGYPFDYALLGDALMEQGKLKPAVDAYQQMVDLKPGLQAYSRIGHVRWITGDLEGAMEAMALAAGAGHWRQPEPLAWVLSRLALYQLQAQQPELALKNTSAALALLADYAPALVTEGRIHLSQQNYTQAIARLRQAVAVTDLPEYLWLLAESLRAAGQAQEAALIEARLAQRGREEDHRTYALYLAETKRDPAMALTLARHELSQRQDVYTQDAMAWALYAAGEFDSAAEFANRALSHGTREARFFYHAGLIANKLGKSEQALQQLKQAATIQHMLMPSERLNLTVVLASLQEPGTKAMSTLHFP